MSAICFLSSQKAGTTREALAEEKSRYGPARRRAEDAGEQFDRQLSCLRPFTSGLVPSEDVAPYRYRYLRDRRLPFLK